MFYRFFDRKSRRFPIRIPFLRMLFFWCLFASLEILKLILCDTFELGRLDKPVYLGAYKKCTCRYLFQRRYFQIVTSDRKYFCVLTLLYKSWVFGSLKGVYRQNLIGHIVGWIGSSTREVEFVEINSNRFRPVADYPWNRDLFVDEKRELIGSESRIKAVGKSGLSKYRNRIIHAHH